MRGNEVVLWTEFASPIGPIRLYSWRRGLLGPVLPGSNAAQLESRIERQLGASGKITIVRGESDALLAHAVQQLAEYFAGARERFDLSLDLCGTPFQLRVWELVQAIPYGQTRSYAALARDLGRPRAARAVGAAVGANPLPIVVPCHRVVGTHGELVGYAGGLACKAWLLEHERASRIVST